MSNAWGKLIRECQDGADASCRKRCDCKERQRLSLTGHSADVMAVMHALLEQTVMSERLARLWGVAELTPEHKAWLLLLAGLHDAGKVNAGFAMGPFAAVKAVERWERGHISPLWALLGATRGTPEALKLQADVLKSSGLDQWLALLREPQGKPEDAPPWQPWLAALAHHGQVPADKLPIKTELWRKLGEYSPQQALRRLVNNLRNWLPDIPQAPPTAWNSRVAYGFAGLLTLADWLGSDSKIFALPGGDDIPDGPDRYAWALKRAHDMLATHLLVPDQARAATRGLTWTIKALTDFSHASPAQSAMLTLCDPPPSGRVCVIEDETGSGKTEAALIHFFRLFEQGAVDGLYFALPTRAAAVQIHARIQKFLARLWGDAAPLVVLAVPGYIDATGKVPDSGEGGTALQGLPPETGRWHEEPDQPWAAERPKRYLAAFIAVGTIDQALMGALRIKHAPLRSASLMRSLLVVDEVHSSDDYMRVVLGNLLDQHIAAGGHALLLSATLGATARCRLLKRKPPPSFDDACLIPYPAVWTGTDLIPAAARYKSSKQVRIELSTAWQDPACIVQRAIGAAGQGARVLIIRNQVKDVISTQMALHALAPDLCLRVNGVAAPHHARFAATDRKLLDAALEQALGAKVARGRGVVVVSSQTAEQSLDIDVDYLISDLCPADVLLQRIGRLHRARQRVVLKGFETPHLLVVAPNEAELAPAGPATKPKGILGLGLIYPNLLGIVATRRALERGQWIIPADNRELVERATHGDHLEALAKSLGENWLACWYQHLGVTGAQSNLATQNCLLWDGPMQPNPPGLDQNITTRLGLEDYFVELPSGTIGPFGEGIRGLIVPHHLVRGTPVPVTETKPEAEGFSFVFGDKRLRYDALGLRVDGSA